MTKKMFTGLFMLVLALGALLLPARTEAARPPAAPETLTITFCWGATTVDPLCSRQDVILYPDGTLTADAGNGPEEGDWTYNRRSKVLTLTFDNYAVVYSGERVQRGCYEGTMDTNDPQNPLTGVWSGCTS